VLRASAGFRTPPRQSGGWSISSTTPFGVRSRAPGLPPASPLRGVAIYTVRRRRRSPGAMCLRTRTSSASEANKEPPPKAKVLSCPMGKKKISGEWCSRFRRGRRTRIHPGPTRPDRDGNAVRYTWACSEPRKGRAVFCMPLPGSPLTMAIDTRDYKAGASCSRGGAVEWTSPRLLALSLREVLRPSLVDQFPADRGAALRRNLDQFHTGRDHGGSSVRPITTLEDHAFRRAWRPFDIQHASAGGRRVAPPLTGFDLRVRSD